MGYILTPQGEKNVSDYLAELSAKRKEILDAGKDTAADTTIPTKEDILADVDFQGLDEDGEYYNGWAITDNCDADRPILLKLGRDLEQAGEKQFYLVPFAYERYGRIRVEAASEAEAIRKAEEELANISLMDLDRLSDYLDDSLEIDEAGPVIK